MNIWNKLVTLLTSIDKDKYMHFTCGVFISFLAVLIFCWFDIPAVTAAMALIFSVIAGLVKDYVIDDKADVWDILATLLGGVIIAASVVL